MMRSFLSVMLLGLLSLVTTECSTLGSARSLPTQNATAAVLAGPAFRERVRIREFADLPRYYTYYSPQAIVAGSDGLLWVVDGIDQDFGVDTIVGIDPSGKAKYRYHEQGTSQGTAFTDIALGSDGALWMPDDLNVQIVRMTTKGRFTNYRLDSHMSPISITSGPDKALWFTNGGGAIGRITTKGKITTYPLSNGPWDIAAGPDGALWFTEPNNGIGRITTTGQITQYSGGITSHPYSIAAGPDGALWFTEAYNGSKIGRITTSGQVTEFSNGTLSLEAYNDIAAGPDGAMWFTEVSN
ncbi:MAG: hypothetical protein JO263_08725, partial [Candidatus Eremiobacteraeota bacterium]|nr:hypothetical protein [Candidatus Eremiobacteraeota bacterium]